jgi:exportin-T
MVRYTVELHLQPELISSVLNFFVGASGIHCLEPRVQLRAWYLFARLLVRVQKNIVPISEQILTAFTDLLEIRVPVAIETKQDAIDSDSDNGTEHNLLFDNQLYLFQSAGLLIALSQSPNSEVGRALLRSLEVTMTDHLGARSDLLSVQVVHHCIMAIGDIAKGIDSASDISSSACQQASTRLLRPATETILNALRVLEDSTLIREAVRTPRRSSGNKLTRTVRPVMRLLGSWLLWEKMFLIESRRSSAASWKKVRPEN